MKLYDDLINGIAEDATVDDLVQGAGHSYVRSGDGIGICGAMDETWRAPIVQNRYIGMPLRALAEAIKSWDFVEAGLGLAAINAWYNNRMRLQELGIEISDLKRSEDRSNDPFIQMQKDVRDKNVTVIGHFPYIDQLFAPVCNLRVIEKFNPKEGDYPEQAADYLLPESEYVFISSYTVVEKSLPRFIALSKNAHITLVGPACPITLILHSHGIHDIAGFAIRDPEKAKNIALGFGGNIHSAGQKINYKRK